MSRATMLETLALAYAGQAAYVSLHSDDPGDDGENELALTRQALTWTGGDPDGVVQSDSVTFAMTSGDVLTHVGIWSDVTDGEFLDASEFSMSFESDGPFVFSLTFTQTQGDSTS